MGKNEKNSPNPKKGAKKPTKEIIFEASLELFSQRGFNAVTVREIARKAGIREGSIYNHYENKEAILNAIIGLFTSNISRVSISEEEVDALVLEGPETVFKTGTQKLIERVNSPQIEKILRIIAIELHENEKIRDFFKKKIIEEPVKSWEYAFSKMIEKKQIKPVNAKILALEFYSYTINLFFEYFIINYNENQQTFADLISEEITNHAEFFLQILKITG